MKSTFAIVKRLLASNKISFIITALVVLCATSSGDVVLSNGNEDVFLPVLAVTGSIDVSTNGGNITFENLDVGNTLTLTVKNGDISGTVAGSYDDFAIQSEIKKGDSNLPNNKESGKKKLNVSGNNGDINIEFLNK